MAERSDGNKGRQYSLHSKISEEYRPIIKGLALKYGSIQRVIEEAIDLIRIKSATEDKFENKTIEHSDLDQYRLTHLMFNDFKMMAVGRRTFLSYIESIPDAPIQENNALGLIDWFYNYKYDISTLSLYRILDAIKKLWIAGNYFTDVQIDVLDGNSPLTSKKFKVIFTHAFNIKNYGEYWTKYLSYVLRNAPYNFVVGDSVVRNQSFYFTVEETHTRSPEQ